MAHISRVMKHMNTLEDYLIIETLSRRAAEESSDPKWRNAVAVGFNCPSALGQNELKHAAVNAKGLVNEMTKHPRPWVDNCNLSTCDGEEGKPETCTYNHSHDRCFLDAIDRAVELGKNKPDGCKDSTLYLYFSGHGGTTEIFSKAHYSFIMPTHNVSESISLEKVNGKLEGGNFTKIIYFIDTCRIELVGLEVVSQKNPPRSKSIVFFATGYNRGSPDGLFNLGPALTAALGNLRRVAVDRNLEVWELKEEIGRHPQGNAEISYYYSDHSLDVQREILWTRPEELVSIRLRRLHESVSQIELYDVNNKLMEYAFPDGSDCLIIEELRQGAYTCRLLDINKSVLPLKENWFTPSTEITII